MPTKNTNNQPVAQDMQKSPSCIFDMHRRHRGALGLYKLALILREGEEEVEGNRSLSAQGVYGVMLAIEHIAYSLYSDLEEQIGALDAQGGAQ